MRYEVIITPRAAKEVDKIPNVDFSKIDQKISQLKNNPRPYGVKKLEMDLHRLRIGNWRIIYNIKDHEKQVIILRAVRRNERTYTDF